MRQAADPEQPGRHLGGHELRLGAALCARGRLAPGRRDAAPATPADLATVAPPAGEATLDDALDLVAEAQSEALAPVLCPPAGPLVERALIRLAMMTAR